MAVFEVKRRVRFGQTDPAGIVFYPRFAEWVNDTVEDFFNDVVGYSYQDMHLNHGDGLPTVNLQMDFLAPAKLGDELTWRMVVTDLGRSSFKVLVTAHSGSITHLTAKATLVLIEGIGTDKMKSVEIPGYLRKVLLEYLEEPTVLDRVASV